MGVTTLICGICFVCVLFLVDNQNDEDIFENRYETEKGWFAVSISLTIFGFNSILPYIEKPLVQYEKNQTLTDVHV